MEIQISELFYNEFYITHLHTMQSKLSFYLFRRQASHFQGHSHLNKIDTFPPLATVL